MTAVDDRHRLEVAERQLALVQSFFPRIDTRVSALFAIASAQVAVAALNLSVDDLTRWFIVIPAALFLLAIIVVLWNLYCCAYPHLRGGSGSLVYFVEIAKRTESVYISEYTKISVPNLTRDIAGQIWRNSEIVAAKYKYLRYAMIAAMLSLLPWAVLLLATSLTHVRIPLT